jgi:hypothetical protein
MLINEMFPNHNACKLRAHAQRRLDKAHALIDPATMLTALVQRPSDNKWLAVVIIGSRTQAHIPALCNMGICVCNV